MKFETEGHKLGNSVRILYEFGLPVQITFKLCQTVRCHSACCEADRYRLDRHASFDQFPGWNIQRVAVATHSGNATNKSTVSMPHLDDTQQLKDKEGFTCCRPGDLELSGNLCMRWQPVPGLVLAVINGGQEILSYVEVPPLASGVIRCVHT